MSSTTTDTSSSLNSIDAGVQQLPQLLSARGLNSGMTLPPLAGAPAPPEKDMIQKIVDWIVSHLPQFNLSPGGLNPNLFRTIATVALIILVIAGVVVLVLLVSRALERKRTLSFSSVDGSPNGKFPLDPEQRLLLEIEKAKQAGNWARASRLRWRLHLFRKDLPASATPKEVLTDASTLTKHYLLMFGRIEKEGPAEGGLSAAFLALEQAIAKLEPPSTNVPRA